MIVERDLDRVMVGRGAGFVRLGSGLGLENWTECRVSVCAARDFSVC